MEKLKYFLKSTEPSKARKAIKVFGTILILLYGFTICLYSCVPKFNTIAELEQRYYTLETRLVSVKRQTSRLKTWRRKYKEMTARFIRVKKALPIKMEIPSLVTDISAAGHESDLIIQDLQPYPEIKKKFYSEIPITVKVSGPSKNVILFFNKISKLPRLVTINNLIMTSAPDEHKIAVSFKAIAYRFIAPKKSKR